MRFVDPGVGTVNEEYLLAALAHHGRLVASGREVCYRREFSPDDDRFIGDAFAVFEDGGVTSVVGIEVKDWQAAVTPKLASSYLATYGRSCDFVYLAARRFLPGVHKVRALGLLALDGPKVLRRATRLTPDPAAWRFVIGQVGGDLEAAPRHPRQRTLVAHARDSAPIPAGRDAKRDA
jgi:hypothetical protein